jgi:hypothetical protein
MWLADLGSSSNGGSNHSIQNYWNIFLSLLHRLLQVTLLHVTSLLQTSVAARLGQTQGPFCTFQLLGAGTRQVQGCAAGLLQSVSKENVLWKSSHEPRHYSAAGRR